MPDWKSQNLEIADVLIGVDVDVDHFSRRSNTYGTGLKLPWHVWAIGRLATMFADTRDDRENLARRVAIHMIS